MREYTIYWIQEEFAHHYFGREGMFFRLFTEAKESAFVDEHILKKQVNYVTKSIPGIHINQFIETEMRSKTSYRLTKEGHMIQVQNGNSKACLCVKEQYLTLWGEGNYEAEMMFFELLRKWDTRFLAMDFKQNRFGWISPIKQRKFV
jgi:hypothetical protein